MKNRFGKVTAEEFGMPKNGILNLENRWVKLADSLDWEGMEEANKKHMHLCTFKTYPFRCILGIFILLDNLEMSTRELLEQVKENPYFQYFLGCKNFRNEDVVNEKTLYRFPNAVNIDYKKYAEGDKNATRDYMHVLLKNRTYGKMVEKVNDKTERCEQLQRYIELLEEKNAGLEEQIADLSKSLQKKEWIAKWNQDNGKETVQPKPLSLDSLNEEQRHIYDMAMEGKDLFITGGAGTGKSYLLRMIIHSMEKEGMNVVVGAPTGMAALHVRGTTLHRLFSLGIGICEDLPVHAGNIEGLISSRAYKVLKSVTVLVIDEISMCRADYFSRIARILAYEKQRGHHIQLILCGDFFQLPPVIGRREKNYFTQTLKNPEGWAFNTKEWKDLNIPMCELKTVIRQNNPKFAEALNQIREGNNLGMDYISANATGTGEDGVSLCGTNQFANDINLRELRNMGNPIQEYEAIIEENKEDVDTDKEIQNVTDKVVKICDGARIIVTVNDQSGLNQYHNGSMGVVTAHTDKSVTVVIDGTLDEVVIERFHYKVYGYDVDWDEEHQRNVINKKVIFAFSQIPIRLGWAITIHKSQGQTYRAMTLQTDSLWKMDGLMYVALSRVTKTDGLKLTGGHRSLYQLRDLLRTSKTVKAFYKV